MRVLACLFGIGTALLTSEANGQDSCENGLAAAKRGDHVTAQVSLERCLAAAPPDQTRLAAKRARRATTRALESGKYAEVSFAITPRSALIATKSVGVTLSGEGTVYLPLGTHELTITHDGYLPTQRRLVLDSRDRVTVELQLDIATPPGPATTDNPSVDFETEPPPALPSSRPQQAEEFPSLIPEKLAAGAPDSNVGAGDSDVRQPRWPYAIIGAGVALAVVGGIAHAASKKKTALGFYLGGGLAIAGGAVSLAITHKRPTPKADPELKLSVMVRRSF